MDSDFWVARLAAAKRQFFNHHNYHLNAHLDSLIVDEMDEDEDDYEMAYPCPYCYAEFEFVSLCHHLEDEHYDETAETACSICADTITGEDMLHHITTEHEPLLKISFQMNSTATFFSLTSNHMALQQNRLQKLPELGSQDMSLLTRDLRDTHLSTHLAGKGHQSSSGMTDPLLSSLVLNYPAPGAEEISKLVTSCAEESTSQTEPAQHIWQSSFDPSLSSEEREKRTRQAAGKAAFVQDLVCSTMFLD
ncbi:Protein DEHYDRATION-INDUCED 19 [Heracleum sosnowskyi]|uniref:Protein DEHYDRATION-INDUCED 19 n=1 Tax=Heracleum sosnowskyi TaxID=360622 RepID=A0AAD8I548_9APIA|nr:Protein DEHYDRATION-INDUCED 19 [Heracleum sosnowskyi]